MLEMIREREFMRVADLSRLLGISEVTVRSDLNRLTAIGSLRRVHGGAISTEGPPAGELTFEEVATSLSVEKDAIGRAAAAMVSSGETLMLDVGTTTAAVARALTERTDLNNIVVFTNGLNIATELERGTPRITVVVTGGTLRYHQHSLVAPMADRILSEVNVAMTIIGCNGIHPDFGVTNVNLPEADVKRQMAQAGRQTIVVADSGKLGKISVAKIVDIGDIDTIVTDQGAPPELVRQFRSLNIEVEVAT